MGLRAFDFVAKLINEADSWFELRDLFQRLSNHIYIPEIHNPFLERIYFLQNRAQEEIEIKFLSELHSQVESIIFETYSDEAPVWLQKSISFGGISELQ